MSGSDLERELFDACLPLDGPGREELIGRECGCLPRLAERVRRLLAAHDRAEERSGDLSGLPFAAAPGADPVEVGPYRLGPLLGEGGMGVVYAAEQVRPIRRKVALKLVRIGMDSNRVVARFEAERQALALMDHPFIARVLDGGAAPDGRPYFVMELVDGLPLKRFCATRRLSVRSRLRLFIDLCRAVQHAHQKGIVHRDLKPSNVLVTEQDGVPRPKVIDFGIAKALELALTESTLHTLHGAPMGTPAYMSPEQGLGTGLDVDTRSDIFSLGVVLYELLTGSLPRDPERLGLHPFLLRLADPEDEPPRPSSWLDPGMPERNTVAAERGTDPDLLRAELAGDLDWVVMKALSHDREQRYQSAEALAAEIQRFLDDQPVRARPPSRFYVFRKFARRNRHLLAAAAVAVVAVAVGVVGLVLGLVQADSGRIRAEQQAARARESEKESAVRLRAALLAQARALTRTANPGRRFESLELLAQAAAIRPGDDLRDEAVSALSLTDIRPVERWPKGTPHHTAMAFFPDLSRYVTLTPAGAIEVRSAGTGGTLDVLSSSARGVWGFRLSPVGDRLAVKLSGWDGVEAIEVWDLRRREAFFRIDWETPGMAFGFSPDGASLAAFSHSGELGVWDLDERKERFRVRTGGSAYDLEYSPDGASLALAMRDPPGVQLNAAADGTPRGHLRWGVELYSIAWSGDGSLLAGASADGLVPVWDAASGSLVQRIQGHAAEVVRVTFHPRYPILLSYGWDETTRIWRARTGQALLNLTQQALGFSRDGRMLATAGGGYLGLWEFHHGTYYREWTGHTGKGPVSLDLLDQGRTLVSGGADGALVWRDEGPIPTTRLPGGDVRSVVLLDTNRVVTCGTEGLQEWDIGLPKGRFRGRRIRSGYCTHAVPDPDRQYILSIFPQSGVFLDAVDPRAQSFRFPVVRGAALPSLSRDAKWLAFGNWRGLKTMVWDRESGETVAELLPGVGSVSVAFSPDASRLITGSAEEYRIWDTGTWSELARLNRPPRFSNLPGKMAFSEDGSWLALALDPYRIQILSGRSGDPVATLQVASPRLWTELRLTPGERRLFASSSDHSIHVWEISLLLTELDRIGLGPGTAGRQFTGLPRRPHRD